MKIPRNLLVTYTLCVILFTIALTLNIKIQTEQQFSYYADSLLHGKLYLLEKPGTWLDCTFKNGHYYWPLGPFPAILLMPFVLISKNLFGQIFPQGLLQFPLTLGVFFLCYKIAEKFKYSQENALLLAFSFCFASPYILIAMVPWGWYFSQAVAVFFSFLAIYEFFKKRRYFVLGLLMSFVLMTRFTAGLVSLFFLLALLTEKRALLKERIEKLFSFSIPIILAGLFLLLINYLRFGSPLDNGYATANESIMSEVQRYKVLNYGLFNIKSVPTNFYYYFIKTPDPVLVDAQSVYGNTYMLKPPYIKVAFPGISFFVSAPIFLYIFRANHSKKLMRLSLIPIFLILTLLLMYYWPGWRQLGPRYTLDFLPLLYLVLLNSFKGSKLTGFTKKLIVVSTFLNLYLLPTIFLWH